MGVIKHVKERWNFLLEPAKGYRELRTKFTFEEQINSYLVLLCTVCIAAALFTITSTLIKVVYFDVFKNAQVEYMLMLNYAFGNAFSLLFFYGFTGTAIMMIISAAVSLGLKKRSGFRYTELLSILMQALSPLLLFGWIPAFVPALLIWVTVLFASGLQHYNRKKETSIEVRE